MALRSAYIDFARYGERFIFRMIWRDSRAAKKTGFFLLTAGTAIQYNDLNLKYYYLLGKRS